MKEVVRQFRLRWKRVGCEEKCKTYWTERAVRLHIELMEQETCLDPKPPLEYTTIECREVICGKWTVVGRSERKDGDR